MSAAPSKVRRARLLPMPSQTVAPSVPSEPAEALRLVLAHSLEEAARLMSRSTRHVRRLIKARRLRARIDGRQYLILDVDLRAYLEGLPSA